MAIISEENMPTVTAVGFILALIALALTAFNTIKINEVAVAVAAFEVRDANDENAAAAQSATKMKALEDRLAAIEAMAKAPPAAPADAAAQPAAAKK